MIPCQNPCIPFSLLIKKKQKKVRFFTHICIYEEKHQVNFNVIFRSHDEKNDKDVFSITQEDVIAFYLINKHLIFMKQTWGIATKIG